MSFSRGLRILGLAAAGTLFALGASAQSNTSSNDPTVGQRKENQQDRISNGIQNGSLTPGETTNLEGKEAAINKETRNMRASDDGHLTAADRAKLNRQQNRLSNQIYTDKHNANTDRTGNGEIGQRKENQQDRIAQGVKSGQLTAGEAAHLERNEAALNGETRDMRRMNGGKLTPGEKRMVNRQQNRQSRQIYRDKHNARKQ